jgi:nitrite reductase/ring-hydroxylating ferredoxin subunit
VGGFCFFSLYCFQFQIHAIKSRIHRYPMFHFRFTINLTIANELTIPGNSMYFPGAGYGGVIVFCEMTDTYYAFDATCTHEINQNCKVVNSGVLGECSCCESKFFFTGGAYPAKGPAAAPLRQYNVSRMSSVCYGCTISFPLFAFY